MTACQVDMGLPAQLLRLVLLMILCKSAHSRTHMIAEESRMAIPRIIHQSWKNAIVPVGVCACHSMTRDPSLSLGPRGCCTLYAVFWPAQDQFKRWTASWRQNHPGWEYR